MTLHHHHIRHFAQQSSKYISETFHFQLFCQRVIKLIPRCLDHYLLMWLLRLPKSYDLINPTYERALRLFTENENVFFSELMKLLLLYQATSYTKNFGSFFTNRNNTYNFRISRNTTKPLEEAHNYDLLTLQNTTFGL